MSTVMTPPVVVQRSAMLCRRSGAGRGCTRLRWHACTACGWTGEPFVGDQPPLDLGHTCTPPPHADPVTTGG